MSDKRNRPHKYIKGPVITGTAELVMHLLAGRYIYWFGKPKHARFMSQLSLDVLNGLARGRHLCLALENTEHPKYSSGPPHVRHILEKDTP